MTFCDVSPFYCDRGGGIRTYHRAKIEWFRRQAQHRYVLVCLGPRHAIIPLGSTVTLIQLRGIRTGRDRRGYRIPLDLPGICAAVRRTAPDVLELDDPWFGGPLGLFVRRVGGFPGLLASFYHSDPIATYVEPWLARAFMPHAARARLVGTSTKLFNRLQASYDVTLVASASLEKRLTDNGVVTRLAPFGVDSRLFDIPRATGRRSNARVRLLYAGRLHADKDIELVINVLPGLLDRNDVEITVAGTGPYRDRFARVSHPRFRYLGFVDDPKAMARLFEEHDVLLAPGRYETFGLAALEAAAAGLVVVGPDAGGTGELLREMGSPFVFTAGDADGFLAATLAAIGSDRVLEVAERSRATARAYGPWPEAIGREIAIYQAMVRGGGH
jgi:alpha-1,6-mannosyltransferase